MMEDSEAERDNNAEQSDDHGGNTREEPQDEPGLKEVDSDSQSIKGDRSGEIGPIVMGKRQLFTDITQKARWMRGTSTPTGRGGLREKLEYFFKSISPVFPPVSEGKEEVSTVPESRKRAVELTPDSEEPGGMRGQEEGESEGEESRPEEMEGGECSEAILENEELMIHRGTPQAPRVKQRGSSEVSTVPIKIGNKGINKNFEERRPSLGERDQREARRERGGLEQNQSIETPVPGEIWEQGEVRTVPVNRERQPVNEISAENLRTEVTDPREMTATVEDGGGYGERSLTDQSEQPQVPRDNWELEEVSSVPTKSWRKDLTIPTVESEVDTETTGEESWTSEDDFKGKTWSRHRKSSTPTGTFTQKTRLSTGKKRQMKVKARKFYRRRRRARVNGKRQKVNRVRALRRLRPKKLDFKSDSEDKMASTSSDPKANPLEQLLDVMESEGGEGEAMEVAQVGTSGEEEKILVTPGGENEKEKETEMSKPTETTMKKKRNKKVLKCTMCEFQVVGNPKMADHMEKIHNIKVDKPKVGRPASVKGTPTSSANPTPSGSASQTPVGKLEKTILVSSGSENSSPEVKEVASVTKKRRRSSEGEGEADVYSVERAKKLRLKLKTMKEESERAAREKREEKEEAKKFSKNGGKGVKGKGKPKTMEEEFEEFKRRFRENEKELAKAKQEAELERSRSAGVRKELEEWTIHGEELLRGKSKSSQEVQKQIRETIEKVQAKEEEVQRWKSVCGVVKDAMKTVARSAVADSEKVKYLQKRQECRDFKKGRCMRGANCKFAHMLPETATAMAEMNVTVNNEVAGGASGAGAQQGEGRKHCIHYERGHCRMGPNCKFIHEGSRYGSRPRSSSHGSNQGFVRPPRVTGNLGVVQEQPGLPMVLDPAVNKDVVDAEIKKLDEQAKKYPAAEQEMLATVREMKINGLLSNDGSWEQLVKAFKLK